MVTYFQFLVFCFAIFSGKMKIFDLPHEHREQSAMPCLPDVNYLDQVWKQEHCYATQNNSSSHVLTGLPCLNK